MHVRFWQNLRFLGVTLSLLEPHSTLIINGSNLKRANSRRKTFEQIANFSLYSIFFVVAKICDLDLLALLTIESAAGRMI